MSFSKPVWWVSYRLESRVPRFDNLPQKTGTNAPSFCSTLLEKDTKLTEQFEFDLKWTANSMYGASMDTVRPSRDRFRSMKLTLSCRQSPLSATLFTPWCFTRRYWPKHTRRSTQSLDQTVFPRSATGLPSRSVRSPTTRKLHPVQADSLLSEL